MKTAGTYELDCVLMKDLATKKSLLEYAAVDMHV